MGKYLTILSSLDDVEVGCVDGTFFLYCGISRGERVQELLKLLEVEVLNNYEVNNESWFILNV